MVPGLIDIHTHATRVNDGPALCLADGVTGLIDAGSQGADRIAEAIAVAKSAPQQRRVLINIGRAGIIPEGDTMDLSRADVAAAREAIGRNREMIAGVKARLSRDVAGPNDFEVLRRAQEVASSFHLPVMIHMGQTMSPPSAGGDRRGFVPEPRCRRAGLLCLRVRKFAGCGPIAQASPAGIVWAPLCAPNKKGRRHQPRL